ncbi:alcohol dehydrogenase catalytic domain-containing protein [Psychromicrobium lacuslunae]|uniref:Alcohol dehydrogenase n=1 Tax=Psychromicrobium lacuslunae TaxID=1618207 RepID=A0A0D4C0K4_9MICC|nr:alcohol dehydrogenase catalytic domain-containing protein [Psychromicrobium lacuslunae]AJT42069.1 alcohol dehydrogenase [Psychromicrobium lacuslunae]
MRAAVLRQSGLTAPYAQSQPLSLEELKLAAPRAGELVVRIERASLCHSDLSVVNGSRLRPLPMALGHEAAGVVTALGEGVNDLEVGQRVVTVFVPSCGSCRACAAGRPALCHRGAESNGSGDLLHGPAILETEHGEEVKHHLGVSAFAEYAVLARESVVPVAEDVPAEVAALFGCAALTGMGAVLNTGEFSAGQSIAVFGLGAVGLAAVMAAAIVPETTVIAVDPLPAKRELAVRCGADYAVAPEEAAELVNQHCGDGVDLVIEAVGSARVIEAGLALLTRGGAVVSVGLPNPEQQLTVQALQFAGAGKRLLGSYLGDAVPERDLPRYLQLWRQGELPIELLHTDTRPLSEINQGLDALASGAVVRRLFVPGE